MPETAFGPAEKLSARETPRVLYAHIRPRRTAIALGGLLVLLSSLAGLAQPLAAKVLVNRLGGDGAVADIMLVLTALVLAGTVLEALGLYTLERTAESVVLSARRQLVARLLRLRVPEIERTAPGDLMSRVISDTTLLHQVTTHSVVAAVTGSLTLVATLVLMGLMDVVLLGVTFGVIAVIAASLGLVLPRISEAAKRAQAAIGLISNALERAFGAFRTIKAAGAEAREAAAVEAAAREAWSQGIRSSRWSAVARSSNGLAIQISFLAVLGVGGARVASGAIPVSTLVAFLLFLFYLTGPISRLVQAATQYQAGVAAIARMAEAERLAVEPLPGLPQPPGPQTSGSQIPVSWSDGPHGKGPHTEGPSGKGPHTEGRCAGSTTAARATADGARVVSAAAAAPGSATDPSPAPGAAAGPVPGPVTASPEAPPASVTFEEVTFRYRDDLPDVHHGVSFTVPGGGMTAFVGPSGAGKSTVFGLIERFWEVTGGRVLIDGTDVRDWPLQQLRAMIGYVEQDAPVLSGTLRENLVFAAPGATDAEIREVLQRTRLDGLVAGLPDGLEAVVGHRGSKLSGGERQRVAIARALLRRPRLLLLDEATSQLDAVNELALRDVVADAARETTVLVVAHRLSTVTLADRIVVMEAGRVRAVGTHQQLVASDPLYGELAATQFLATVGPSDPPAPSAAPSSAPSAPSATSTGTG